MIRYPDHSLSTRYERELAIVVDPVRARFSSWYEFFPRSTSPIAGQHGTFKDCEAWLPYVARMGFDVIYFPPIHPIGVTFRKGKNNSVIVAPTDGGSPWAIGGTEGGHKSIHPNLGTLDEFRALVRKAKEHEIQIALDVAFQVSPDHPYVKEHPQWFRSRPDGTIQYAENPPKKYQISTLSISKATIGRRYAGAVSQAASRSGIEQGVEIFRVDNIESGEVGEVSLTRGDAGDGEAAGVAGVRRSRTSHSN